MASTVSGYGGPNVMLVRNESSTDTLVAMLASCSSVQLQGSSTRHSSTRIRGDYGRLRKL